MKWVTSLVVSCFQVKFISTLVLLLLVTTSAHAVEHRSTGYQLDLGVPDGAGIGVVVRPTVDWLRLGLSLTYNGLAPGLRLGATLDPIDYPIVPTLTLEAGTAFGGTVPILDKSPGIGYDYLNLHLGLEGGVRDVWRFFLHLGPTWINFRTSNYNQLLADKDQSIMLSNPHGSAALFPCIKLGFTKYFE